MHTRIIFEKPNSNNLTLKERHEKVKELLIPRGFKKRGNAYFRVIGDGVLQVIQLSTGRPLTPQEFWIGFFSMYDDLLPQWFTSGGCIPRYCAMKYAGFKSSDILFDYGGNHYDHFQLSFEEQLYIMENYVLDELDQVVTQKGIVDEIMYIEHLRTAYTGIIQVDSLKPYLEGKTTREQQFFGFLKFGLEKREAAGKGPSKIWWNDGLKFTPFLKSGQFDLAEKVIQRIVDQNELTYKPKDEMKT